MKVAMNAIRQTVFLHHPQFTLYHISWGHVNIYRKDVP